MWKRILAHGAAALATPGLRRYRLCLRALVFVAVFVADCATSRFPEELAGSADRALTLRERRSDTTARLGERVILSVNVPATTPKPRETEIEVFSRPLRAGDVPAVAVTFRR